MDGLEQAIPNLPVLVESDNKDQPNDATAIVANHLIFKPAANANGTGTGNFTFQVQDNGGTNHGGIDLDQAARREMLLALTGRCECDGESRTLFDTAGRVATSLAEVFQGHGRDLALPDRVRHAAT